MSRLSKDVLLRLDALYPKRPRPSTFPITTVAFNALDASVLSAFLRAIAGTTQFLGVAGVFKPKRKLAALVIATPTTALFITGLTKGRPDKAQLLETYLTCNDELRLLGAHADALAYGLYTDVEAYITNGVDLHSLAGMPHKLSGRDDQVYPHVLGAGVNTDVVRAVFCNSFAAGGTATRDAVVRARELAVAVVPWVLDVAASLHRIASLVDAQKPATQTHDVEDVDVRKGDFEMICRRYKTRVRVRGPRRIELADGHGNTVVGTVRVDGRKVMVSVPDSLPTRLKTVTSLGKEYTLAEEQKEELLVRLLQGSITSPPLSRNPAFCAVWGINDELPGPAVHTAVLHSPTDGSGLPQYAMEFSNFVPAVISGAAARLAGIPLNPSQHRAVRAILRTVAPGQVDVDTIIGPPGTGKTMVIAASVVGLRSMERPVWLVAHSNVAVKNVAQKLADIGFLDFKLVVSWEFHYDWHEHLYAHIEQNVILTSQLVVKKGKKPPPIESLLGGSQVILCTLGTLTGLASRFKTFVPVDTLIVDEASQIELGEYLAPMHMYGDTLQKIVFVGDDKQLAPYGQDEIGNAMRSIFEVPKHRARAVMLDISYRLPRSICEFISRRVYDNKLHAAQGLSARDSCKFVDLAFRLAY
ncbi:P-loop containing nucleoside triphosphate hydrolase protein [Auricularia subglabra TFB-10046 SS5]|nr:P-loop containing nucleoside triphosphate hydrolase protein [Auricularia subglabra TFB-10046 SS5]